MNSCMNCKSTEETIFDNNKKCINEESEYCNEFVDERDLCMCWEEEMNDIEKALEKLETEIKVNEKK